MQNPTIHHPTRTDPDTDPELAALAEQFDAASQGKWAFPCSVVASVAAPVVATGDPHPEPRAVQWPKPRAEQRTKPCAAKRGEPGVAPANVSGPRSLPLPPWEDDPAAAPILSNCATSLPGQPGTPDFAASSSPGRPRPPVLAPFKIDADRFREEVAISAADPHGCWLAQPELEAYYGQWVSHADAECERARAHHAVLEARLFDHHRKVLAAQGGRVLERAVECAVKMEASWQAAMQAVLDAQAIAQGNQRLMQVLQNRHAILMQLCAEERMPSRSMPVES